MNSYVPINIKPHLAAFFFQEIDGKEIHYLKSRAKSFEISKLPSLNNIIRILLVTTDIPIKNSEISILLTIDESDDKKIFTGTFYKPVSGKNHFLKVPPEANKIINNLLEDIFNISLVYYVLGHVESDSKSPIKNGLDSFIDKYDLYELGFSYEGLRKRFYRITAKNKKLSRMIL